MSTITLTEDYGYTNYRVDGLADGTVIDASGASWIQDNDASDGQSNPYPFMVYDAANVVLQGGTIDGNIDQTDAWRDVYDEGNSAGIRTEGTPNVVISDWRISNTWDAIRVSWDSPNFLIEDVWVTDARDDAIENDRLQSGTIRDSLFDGVFAGMSIDPSSSSPVDGSGETILMDGVLMRLELSLYEGQMTHGSFIKTDSATDGEVTPNLRFIDCVIAIEDVNHRSYRSMFDTWDHTIQSENNYYLNLSDEPLPADYPMPPAGWTVLQGQEARDYWNAARDEWVAEHGDTAALIPGDPVENIFAEDDSNSGDEGTVISGTVAANDTTTSGGELTFAVAANPDNGTVLMNTDGSYAYAPDALFKGEDRFTYTVTDTGSGEQKTQTVTITVDPVENIFAEDDSNSGGESTVISGTVTDAAPTVFETRISSGADDVEERSSGSIYTNSSDLEMADDGGNIGQTTGLRFTNIDIPEGAIITSAYIQFQVDEVSTGSSSLTIRGENTNDAAAFTTASFDVSSRDQTEASAVWEPDGWTTVGGADLVQQTSDLTAIVQEVLDRGDWAALNDLAFIITGTGERTAESFEGSAAGAPLLHVEYIMPDTGNAAPVLDLDQDDSSGAGTGYATTFVERGVPVPIADGDAVIADTDDTDMERATITLTNASAGDALTVNLAGLPSGIIVNEASTATNIILSGTASLADYQLALQQVLFNNASATPESVDRVINVVVNDGSGNSNTAVATVAIDLLPDAADDSAAGLVNTTTVTGNVLANDDQGDMPTTIVTYDTVGTSGGAVASNGNGTFDYTPVTDFTGTDTFTYTIQDSNGDQSTATVAVAVTISDAAPRVFETRISSGADDVEERSSGSIYTNSSDLEMADDGGNIGQTTGLRFTNIDIPEDAIITSAYIQFQVDEVSTGSSSLTIWGENTNDAAAFTTARFDVSSRDQTEASAVWEPDGWSAVGVAGFVQQTSDLTAIVQEVLDRGDWAALNDLAFIITGTGERTAESFEGSAAGAPLLHVEYIMPDDGNTAPVLEAGLIEIDPGDILEDAALTANQVDDMLFI